MPVQDKARQQITMDAGAHGTCEQKQNDTNQMTMSIKITVLMGVMSFRVVSDNCITEPNNFGCV